MLNIQPIDLAEANEFVTRYHRHHKPVQAGYKYCIGVNDHFKIVGVAIIGLPVARALCDGYTLEVRRVCTDGTKNASSMLYGASWRAAKAMGYKRLITYILEEEPGVSLRAAGWRLVGKAGGGTWNRPNTGRIRFDTHPITQKKLYEVTG